MQLVQIVMPNFENLIDLLYPSQGLLCFKKQNPKQNTVAADLKSEFLPTQRQT